MNLKKIKKVLCFAILVMCFVVSSKNVDAMTLSPRAIRYDFDTQLYFNQSYTQAQYPLGDDGMMNDRFRYMRVRIEAGSGHGDTIDISAVGTVTGLKYTLGTAKTLPFSGDRTYVIDFKAPNAPTRSDADITINCNIIDNVSTNDYCISNPTGYYGIYIYNGSLSSIINPARIVGGFSFEN